MSRPKEALTRPERPVSYVLGVYVPGSIVVGEGLVLFVCVAYCCRCWLRVVWCGVVVCAVRVFVYVCVCTWYVCSCVPIHTYEGVSAHGYVPLVYVYRVRACVLACVCWLYIRMCMCVMLCANVYGVCFGFGLCSTQALSCILSFISVAWTVIAQRHKAGLHFTCRKNCSLLTTKVKRAGWMQEWCPADSSTCYKYLRTSPRA